MTACFHQRSSLVLVVADACGATNCCANPYGRVHKARHRAAKMEGTVPPKNSASSTRNSRIRVLHSAGNQHPNRKPHLIPDAGFVRLGLQRRRTVSAGPVEGIKAVTFRFLLFL